MDLSCFSRSKYRFENAPGEDVLLLQPGLAGVFDGATDPTHTQLDGMTSGRFAALTCAAAVSRLWALGELSAGETLLHRVNQVLEEALARKTAEGQFPPGTKRPSTTMALAWEQGDTLQFFLIGDSGVRLNGQEEIILRKQVDALSTYTRVACYRLLEDKGGQGDALEAMARTIIYYGLDQAVAQGILEMAERAALLERTLAAFPAAGQEGERFLRQGIVSQQRFANQGQHPFGYATLNGTPLAGEGMLCFSRSRAEIQSVEFFTDGYFRCPAEVSVVAWEQEFERVEREDYHKIGACPAIKGSTAQEFSDDRTVIVMHTGR